MPAFGNRSRFRIEIASVATGPRTRAVDVWAAGQWLTCDDNIVDVPQFTAAVHHTLVYLLDSGDPDRERRPMPELSVADNYRRLLATVDRLHSYAFLDWGPTTDNVAAALFREGGLAFVPFTFWRPEHRVPAAFGEVFVVELSERELLSVLHQTAWTLTGGAT